MESMRKIKSAAVRQRPAAALEDLYRTEYTAMVRLAYTLVGSNAEAEEIVQDSFMEISRRLADLRQPGGYLRLAFWDVRNIYAEGCQWVLVDPPVGPTVDDLVSTLANVPAYAASAAVDVTVDGYTGKQIAFTVPDFNKDECKEKSGSGVVGLWQEDGDQDVSTGPHFWAQGSRVHNTLYILDVDGTRLLIDAYTLPDASPQVLAALDEVIASVQIG